MPDRCLETWWRQQATSAHRTWRTRIRVPLVRTDGLSVCLKHQPEGRGLSRVAGPTMAGAPRACSCRLRCGSCGCHRSAGCSRVQACRRPRHPCVQRRFSCRSSRAASCGGTSRVGAGGGWGSGRPVAVAGAAGSRLANGTVREAPLDMADMDVLVAGLSAEEMRSLRAAVLRRECTDDA